MSLSAYSMLDPSGPVCGVLRKMASEQPYRASRLVTALEEFVWNGGESGSRVLPEGEEHQAEIYLVPPRFVLSNIPDAAALLRVDHVASMITIILVIENYGGPGEGRQWAEIKRIANQALHDRYPSQDSR
jgi:hypothetical protein